jgi:putative ABC transport system substrate-binding protein
MRRREFITLLGGAAAARPLAAFAQQPERVQRIGVLLGRKQNDPEGQSYVAAFEQGLAESGWLPHRNIEIDYHWQTDAVEKRLAIAKDLVASNVDLLVANSTPNLVAARAATRTIPIVFVAIADPVVQGFVKSLARPGGMITGFGAEEPAMGAKWVELLQEIAPHVGPMTAIFNPNSAPFARLFLPSIEALRPAGAGGVTISQVHDESETEQAVAAAARRPASGLIFLPDSFLASHRDIIVGAAAKYRLPAIYAVSTFVQSGGLIAYGIDRADLFRRAADYVARILKGSKPADLPVQMPAKFELVINLKTARTLGITVSPMLLARADKVIE